jgi:hypothetical protein
MSIEFDEIKPEDVERERQERLEDLVAEDGSDWADAYAPGTHGCHELYDRTMLAFNMVEELILSHPACVQDPEWFSAAYRSFKALEELYERIGSVHITDDDEPEDGDEASDGDAGNLPADET